MPSQIEIEGAEPLTETGAAALLTYLRVSEFYLAFSYTLADLKGKIEAYIGSTEPEGLLLSAVLTKIEKLKDGTVAVRGGKFAADYSQNREREFLSRLALASLYDFAALGIGKGADNVGAALLGGPRGGSLDDPVDVILPYGYNWR